MSVFSYRTFENIEAAAGRLFTTFFGKMPLMLDPDEFIAAFINPEHIDKLKEVQEIVGLGTPTWTRTTGTSSSGSTFSLYATFGGGAPVVLPRYVSAGLQPTCPDPVRQKITAWLDERVRFGDMFGDVRDALTWLNAQCADAEAMALLLPCLPTIMGRLSDDSNSKAVKRARKLTSIKSFGALPKLPVKVKQRMQEISAVVNSITLMLDAPDPELDRGHACFALESARSHKRESMFAPGAQHGSFV